jgi:hypothetical protein
VAALRMLSGRNGKLVGSGCSGNMSAVIGGRCVYAGVLLGALRVTGGYGWSQNVDWDSDKCNCILLS